jgi:hypothetical protein
MILSDLPPREQERYLDGITIGIGTRELGRPASDRERLDPWHGGDEGWLWRRGFDVGFEGCVAEEDLAALPHARRGGSDQLSARLEGSEALHPHCAPALIVGRRRRSRAAS